MAFNVAATQDKSVNEVGFLDLQPVNMIEVCLLGASNLTHPTNVIESGLTFDRRSTQVCI